MKGNCQGRRTFKESVEYIRGLDQERMGKPKFMNTFIEPQNYTLTVSFLFFVVNSLKIAKDSLQTRRMIEKRVKQVRPRMKDWNDLKLWSRWNLKRIDDIPADEVISISCKSEPSAPPTPQSHEFVHEFVYQYYSNLFSIIVLGQPHWVHGEHSIPIGWGGLSSLPVIGWYWFYAFAKQATHTRS